MFFWMFGFYTAWMMGIAALAYQKLKGFDDYATHFVGRKDYGVFVMMLTMFASWISGNTITNAPNTASVLGYVIFWLFALYSCLNIIYAWVAPRIRRLSVARQWNSFSDVCGDRFRNPVLILFTLIYPTMSLEGYIIAQFWALRALVPVVSDNLMHDDRMSLLLGVVIFICESFGGFDAVSYTDVIQGCCIVVALLIGPIYMSYHFGTLSGCVEFECPNTWFEVLPDPEDENVTVTKRRGCYAYKSPWNTLYPAGITYSYYFKPLWPTYGIDGSLYFQHIVLFVCNFVSYIVSYCCFPHVTCRLFASKSDFHCRSSLMWNGCFLAPTAGLPGLLLGFFYSIHIERMYPAGTVTFGGILDFMMRQGGAPEFFACLAGCGGIAGVMSTIDSCALAITNIVTKELVVNGLFRVLPHLDTHRFMTVSERSSTGFALILALYFTIIFLASKVESDPIEAKMMITRIGFYQFGFIAQSFPSFLCILYIRSARPLPMILAQLFSMIVLPTLSMTVFEQKYYGSNLPEGQPTHLYIHVITLAMYCNVIIIFATNAVLPDSLAYAFTIKSEKESLTFDQMLKIMEGTVEPLGAWPGRIGQILFTFLYVFMLPWYHPTHNKCNYTTYKEYTEWVMDNSLPKPPDCVPEVTSPCKSFPAFGGAMLGCGCCLYPFSCWIIYQWKPDKSTLTSGSKDPTVFVG